MMMDDAGQWHQRLETLLGNPAHGAALRADFADGLPTHPAWRWELLRPVVMEPSGE